MSWSTIDPYRTVRSYPRLEAQELGSGREVNEEMVTSIGDKRHDVAVVGAGQAGLAASWYLQLLGIDHVVLERDRVGESWRSARWDS
jgi:ribulose 1,5-bisphosphate synthetase/thiazole synthase